MSDAGKQTGKSFLQKFQGKTNKVSKQGIQQTLVQPHQSSAKEVDPDQKNPFRKVDLDSIIPSNPQKRSLQHSIKRREGMNKPSNQNTSKVQYVPSSFTPQQNISKEESTSLQPPSRGLSLSTENSRGKYFFGKYLKLDKEAMGHIQFLQSIEEKRSFFHKNRRSARSPNLK